ncbi:MAG: Fic family protein [Agathobacter sp.]
MLYNDVIEFWKQKNIRTEAELEAVLHSYCVDFSFHSGKIENDKVTYHDTREIFDKDGVTSYTGDLRTLFEIKNSKIAYERILKAFDTQEPLSESFVKEIQKLLTRGTYDQRRYLLGERPGEYKKGDYVTGRNEVGALAEDVSEEMEELLEELNDVSDMPALTVAAYFHAKFENIHPFSDGNGRTGRLLMNYLLVLMNHPPIVIHEEDRKAYYDALECFDLKLDLKPFQEFLKMQTVKTWEKSLLQKERRVAEYKNVTLSNIVSPRGPKL